MGRAARESENIVGTNIRAARLSANMTQAELSGHVGISIESLSRAERGTILPTVNTLGSLATVLGTTIDALAGRTQARPRQATDAHRDRLHRLVEGLDAQAVRAMLAVAETLQRR